MRAFEEKDKHISIGTSNDGASLMATHLYTTSHLQSKSHAVTKVSARPFQSCSHGHLQALAYIWLGTAVSGPHVQPGAAIAGYDVPKNAAHCSLRPL